MDNKSIILIVDDDSENLLYLSNLLNQEYHTKTAYTGKEAIAIAKSVIPDLILLDIMLPEMNGFEVCQQLKSDEQFCDIPVLFLSAYYDEIEGKIKGFEVGGVDYIVKPFYPAEMLVRVKTHLHLRNVQKQLQEQNKQLQAEMICRQKAEHDLRESEEKYRLLFEKTNDAVFIIGLDFHHIAVNQQAADLLGYGIDELIQKPSTDYIVPDEYSDSITQAERLKAGETLPIYERNFRKKNGEVFPAEVKVTLIHNDEGEPLYYHSVVRDISERKKNEAERERLIAELDAFAHTVAHDLKSPLSTLKLSSEMLELMFDKLSEEKRQRRLVTIQQNADKMAEIIDALLLLASVRKKDDIPITHLQMASIIDSTLVQLKVDIASHGAQITIADNFPMVLGYRPWIEEVWSNYIQNALKYGGKPPHLEIGTNTLPDDSVCFWVKDNGQGLSDLDFAQIKGGIGLSL